MTPSPNMSNGKSDNDNKEEEESEMSSVGKVANGDGNEDEAHQTLLDPNGDANDAKTCAKNGGEKKTTRFKNGDKMEKQESVQSNSR